MYRILSIAVLGTLFSGAALADSIGLEEQKRQIEMNERAARGELVPIEPTPAPLPNPDTDVDAAHRHHVVPGAAPGGYPNETDARFPLDNNPSPGATEYRE